MTASLNHMSRRPRPLVSPPVTPATRDEIDSWTEREFGWPRAVAPVVRGAR